MSIKVGEERVFKYTFYGTPDNYPDHTAHSGQIVTVISEVGNLYMVRASDGWEGTARGDELKVLHGRKVKD